jgi:tripartite-type tricarboxylate transporter receptor subunit TctC
MTTDRRAWLRGAGLVLAAGWAGLPSTAQEAAGASRPISLVVPFAAGGGTDTVARLLGARLQALLGRTVVIENRPGANGIVASQAVLQQPADGHTLLLGSYSTHVIAPLASRRNPEAARATLGAYAALAVVGYAPLALAVASSSPSRTLADFLNNAKSRRTTYGSFGAGSSAHLLGQILASRTQAQLEHVPYKGSAPAANDLLGGHVDSVILTAAALHAQVAGGQLRALAVSSKARLPAMPGVPTFTEAGFAGLAETGWFSLFVHAKVPGDVKARLSAAMATIMADPTIQQRLIDLGLEPPAAGEDAGALWQRSIVSARSVLATITFDPE